MENYLYFRKFRPTTFLSTQGSATQTLNTITGVGGDDIDSATEIASLVVTPADDANSNIGSAYSHPGAGGNLTLSIANGAIKTCTNNVVTLNNNSEDADSGYTLESGDKVLITLQQGLETSFAYPVSRLKGVNQGSANTETVLHFDSIKNDSTDDTVTLTHTAGKFETIVKALNDACNGYPKEGKLISVIDGGEGRTGDAAVMKELAGCGITSMVVAFESGY
jgi:hypothetical protein